MSGQCELLDHPRLIAQLTSLERKTGRLHDTIDHRQDSHDDCANCVAGALSKVLRLNVIGTLTLIQVLKNFESGARQLPASVEDMRGRTQVNNLEVQNAAAQKAKPRCPSPNCAGPVVRLGSGAPSEAHWHCNNCATTFLGDGTVITSPKPVGDMCPIEGCGLKLFWSGGHQRCANHGQMQRSTGGPTNGATFKDLKKLRNKNQFGRFG
jgi:hypothetical protein